MKLFERKTRRDLWLIVGLGNPGKQYESTRHNVGFWVVDRWAARHGIDLTRKRAWAFTGEGQATIGDRTFRAIVAKPRTFMNLSGEAVLEMVHRHQVDLANLIVVYDDLDLAVGKLRLRERGSAGTHNGMKSIVQRLGSQDFPRLRIGIGRPEPGAADAVDFVLGAFRPAEREAVDAAATRACDCIDAILAEGIERAMNVHNA